MSELTERGIEVPTDLQAQRAVAEARRQFQRTLASWASDLLVLRRRGITRPAWTPTSVGLDRAA
ncbi:MAG: hypothetical protein ACYTJ0_04460 [Planctomycetota bacterium]